MEGIQSSVVSFTLLLAIFGPHVSFGNRRTCFCHSWMRPPTGDERRLVGISDSVYTGFLVGCSKASRACPNDCKQTTLNTLGGSKTTFTRDAGNRVCSTYGRESTAPGLSVGARYKVSNCGGGGTHLLAEHVCCAQRCLCRLMANINRNPVELLTSDEPRPSPYYACHDEDEVQSDCKNECINIVEDFLMGSVSPNYADTSSSELCRRMDANIPSPGAQVYVQYTTGGITETVNLHRMCCFKVSGIPTAFANRACANIG